MIRFEWDPSKGLINEDKHGVTFEEAQSVFFDEYAIQFFDVENSNDEDRFLMLGLSNETRILLVCHCEREDGEVIRIISARRATRNEQKYYTGGVR
ncbi:MAG: BrnT family toxin [Pseudomonadota bacterium]|nr:BrnT family toxin [Pseudomonadota bacterium]